MKKILFGGLGLLAILGLLAAAVLSQSGKLLSPYAGPTETIKPLDKYSFEKLRRRIFPGSEIKLVRAIEKGDAYTSYLFTFEVDGGTVSGQANIPDKDGKYPVVVMIRGYADNEIYFTGLGTRKAAGVFAQNGFITLAPDFLGFGSSDACSQDILEARFEKPVTVLELLASVKSLEKANPEKLFLWGHSNGGQITLSVLEITQRPIPTTLWAPVSKGFPESVLVYTGQDENGNKVKKRIEEFSRDYDVKKYSIDNYFVDIKAPLQLHQGLADPLVSVDWSNEFVEKMKSLGKEVNYYKYPRNDHNLSKDWDTVVQRDLGFYKKFL